MDTMTAMRMFVVLAERRSITKTSLRLGVSKSEVSKHIKALSKELGVHLIETTTRSVALTAFGKAFLPHAIKILDLYDEAQSLMQGRQPPIKGLLNICVVSDFGVQPFSRIIGDFVTAFPKVRVNVTVTHDRRELLSDKFDVLIFLGNLQGFVDNVIELTSVPMHLVASPAYLEEYGTPRGCRDLYQYNLLCYSGQLQGSGWQLLDGTGSECMIEVNGRIAGNSPELTLAMCVEGHGIAYLPLFVCQEALDAGQLVSVLSDFPVREIKVTVGYNSGMQNSSLAEIFVTHMKKAFSSEG